MAADDLRARLAGCIEHLDHVLPGQASIRDFVHHNTLHGYQHLPFAQALTAAGRTLGLRAWMPEEQCRALYREGRIDDADVDAALDRLLPGWGIAGDEALPTSPPLRRRDVLRAGLLHPIGPIPLAQLKWQIEEKGALAGASADLWAACLDVLGLDHRFDHPEELFELAAREEEGYATASNAGERFTSRAAALWDELAAKVSHGETAAGLVKALTDEDAFDVVRPLLIRHLAAHLDLGLAPWHNPARNSGFYGAWRASVAHDLAWPMASMPGARQEVAGLPDDVLDAVIAEFGRLGLPETCWEDYLERLALELPGWSGMFLWRQHHPGYAGTADVPVAMMDYLAVRLVLERLAAADTVRRHWGVEFSLPALGDYFRAHPAELLVRHAFHSGDLPEWLLDLIEPHLPPAGDAALSRSAGLWEWLAEHVEAWRETPTAEQTASHGLTRSAWPLFLLAQHLGVSGEELRAAGRAGAEALLGCLRQLDDDQRGFLWLNAYERHYREQIFAALAANHGRWRGHEKGPTAQLVFCMDDREEGMRRHLEEIAPQVETLGGAAHFGVFQNYLGLDDKAPTPLCPVVPVVIVPAHNVREVPRAEAEAAADRHRRRQSRRRQWHEHLHQGTRSRPLVGTALAALAAPMAFLALLARSLAPGWLGRLTLSLREHFDLRVPTRLALTAAAEAGPATPEAPRQGFTDAEQAERVAGYMTAIGLTRNFAPLVVIMGHGSNSQNNPHLAAYDCGACAGRHSGPNARLLAAMANRPEVRALLHERGIDIPAATHFIGAEHNTADDLVTWYDTEDIPVSSRLTFERLDRDLARTVEAHAQERCRRLFSAPLGISRAAARAHVWARRNDWSQARPELGHATNACAFIGRRAMSRGAFFDRRAFLISYDPTRDPEGKVLERHLLVNGAVGAGISLEYFFSTANNERFGCGSKITHNVAGYFGVMQGACSDLATGLPRQMIEVHEAMRLLVVIEQSIELITAIYQRQPPLQELVGNGWVIVAAKDPESGAIQLFDPATGWQPWQGRVGLPTVKQSADWFAGHREPLAPVLLERPLECPA